MTTQKKTATANDKRGEFSPKSGEQKVQDLRNAGNVAAAPKKEVTAQPARGQKI